jgi:Trp operon repressor
MSQDKRTAKDDAIYLRRFKALELRIKAKMTMREIAKECGISVSTAWKDVQWMLDHETEERGDYVRTYREVESERLDEWQAKLLTTLEMTSDVDDQKKMFDVLLKISERRAKLLGLDAPVKQEVDMNVNEAATPTAARQYMQELFTTGLKPPTDGDEPS